MFALVLNTARYAIPVAPVIDMSRLLYICHVCHIYVTPVIYICHALYIYVTPFVYMSRLSYIRHAFHIYVTRRDLTNNLSCTFQIKLLDLAPMNSVDYGARSFHCLAASFAL